MIGLAPAPREPALFVLAPPTIWITIAIYHDDCSEEHVAVARVTAWHEGDACAYLEDRLLEETFGVPAAEVRTAWEGVEDGYTDRLWISELVAISMEELNEGCAVGALYFAHYGDVPPDHTLVIDWAVDVTGSRTYVQGFDAGFHDFAQAEDPTHDYTLGLADGQLARSLVDEPTACRPALWCWVEQEEGTDGTTSPTTLAHRPRARG